MQVRPSFPIEVNGKSINQFQGKKNLHCIQMNEESEEYTSINEAGCLASGTGVIEGVGGGRV